MQHSHRLARAVSYATWAAILMTVLSVAVSAHAPHPGYLDPTAAYAWCGLAAGVAAAYTGVSSRPAMTALAGRAAPVLGALGGLSLVADAGILASTGGVAGPYWVPLIPLVLFTGLAAPLWWSTGLGLLASGALVVSTAASAGLSRATTGPLLLVGPVFPILGATTAVLSASVLRVGRRVVEERDALTEHVQALSEALAAAASGNLAVPVPKPRRENDALETLSDKFADTLADLRRLVDSIRGGGEQINASAVQLLATAEEHAASATQQSSAVAETTSTIEELAATAAQIAETAELVARYAADTLRFAEQGSEAVSLSVDAMDKISQRVSLMASRAFTLGERTNEIGRIVEVIEDLADQTNLLALNAAIEAARAGEHGRGFAVVATEVRKLAERARRSTGQIRDIVTEVQAETSATILASEDGDREAQQGATLARAAADALARISSMVDETTVAAKEISIATQQQRSASDQVVAAMTQVSDVSRHYAVGSQQTAASAAQLSSVAHELREAISAFVVD